MIRLKTLLNESTESNYDLNTIEFNGKRIEGRTVDSPSYWDRWTYFIGNDGNYYTKLKSSTSGWKNLNILSATKFAAAKKLIDTFETATNTGDVNISELFIKNMHIDTTASRNSSTNNAIKVKGYLTMVDANGKRVYPNQAQLQKFFGNDTIVTCESNATSYATNQPVLAYSKPLTSLNFELSLPKKIIDKTLEVINKGEMYNNQQYIDLRFYLADVEFDYFSKAKLSYDRENIRAVIAYDDIKKK